ncbi:MAG: universal stress protein, partial [Bacteroidales bacterium]|nr:universal stress protein [Bacteroidales bacterium]
GVTGFEEFWIGSNAYRIVINAPCPVITVRHQFDLNKKIQKIVIPIDNTRNTIQKVPYIARVALAFDAEVHILALYSTVIKAIRKKVDIAANDAQKLMEKLKVKCFLESMIVENVTQCTLNYASKIDAELISIMTEQETTEANILLGEYARQMVNNSPIPVLSIHPNEIWTFEKR